ncbi:MAG: GMC family oxidoreductase [Myxococcales bacterium]|nr:GMC family oxidoreductase [Myxococcales bacterium]
MSAPGGFVDAGTVGTGKKYTPEVCIIGSGAGGAVSAALLTAAGHDVLVVEEGGHRTRKDFNMREDVAFAQLYQEGATRATKDLGITLLQGRTVGGTTVVNWTTCFRTPDPVLDHWRDRHGVRGLTSADLAPHFAAVEERLSIAEIPLADSNRNNRLLYDGCKALGLEATPTKRNVKQCMKSGYCGMGCPVDAKQSMLITYLPDAVARGATVLYRCRIERLEIEGGRVVRARGQVLGGPSGRTPTGEVVVIEAKRFLVSAGAINSPALLLRSGLGGADTPIGRRTFLHPVVGITGHYKDLVEPYYGAPQSIASHALAHRGADVGLFLEAAPIHPVIASTALPGFGDAHRRGMIELPNTAAHIALAIDGFSPDEPGGTVTLRPSGAALVDYPIPPRIWEAFRFGLRKLAEIDLAAGADVVRTGHDPSIEVRSVADLAKIDAAAYDVGRVSVFSAHQMGGCAMGPDPKTAVVRPEDLRHHSVENLHVVDGSVFPTSLGVNPQESIYGLAHLTATRLHASWGQSG